MKLYYQTLMMIAMIPDEKDASGKSTVSQKELREELDKNISEAKKKYRDDNQTEQIDPLTENHIIIVQSTISMGKVTNYIDRYLGLSHNNKVGWIRTKKAKN